MPLDLGFFVMPLAVAFVVSMIVAPLVIRALRRLKLGQTIQKDGPESHFSKAGTPTMGGVVILAGFLAPLLAMLAIWTSMGFGGGSVAVNVIALTALVICYALLGMIDDYLTIRPIKGVRGIASKPKAALQVLLASGFVWWLSRTDLGAALYIGGTPVVSGLLYWMFAVVFIVGMANFVNITDGLDGLVSGLTLVACVGMASALVYTMRAPNSWSSLMLGAMAGACLAFLWFNTNPARVFMGDTGSLAIGVLLPALAVITHHEVLMIVIGSVFILDGFSTIIQWAVFKYTRIRTGTGRRVFLKSPVHHHFEMAGWPEQTVVVRFWICGIIAAVVGYAGAVQRWW